MSKVEVVMPQLGESLTEGTIVKWHKKPGDRVKKEEVLLEISTDKVDSEIPSPATGVVTKLLFEEQKTVSVRTVIAEIETDVAAGAAKAVQESPAPPGPPKEHLPKSDMTRQAPEAAGPAPAGVAAKGRFYSPLVLNIARTEGISMAELEGIPGTGEGGRVSKKDIQAYIEAHRVKVSEAPIPHGTRIDGTLKHVETGELVTKYPPPRYEILQMSNLVMKMSEHMHKSIQTSPHVQAIHECDMTKVDRARRSNAEAFERREGFKLTYTPFVCNAVIKVLKEYPLMNSSVEGDKIVLKKFINLGIAVASENGLIVPVIKDAEEKNFVGLARAVNDLAMRARIKKLVPSDIEGGTFTITNYGVFGTMIGIPIINQPQVAILGTGAIEKRPVVINDAIAIRSMAYFTLSFDHRIIDGALGGNFLEAVVKKLENYDDTQTI